MRRAAIGTTFYGSPALPGAHALARALPLFLIAGLCLSSLDATAKYNAFQLAPASLLTPFAYLQMLWATSYGFAIFGQLPDRWSAFGMTVIVASGLPLALPERRRAGRSAPVSPS